MRKFKKIIVDSGIKQKLLAWANSYREVVFLDSNNYPQLYSSYDAVLAVDALTLLQTDSYKAFEKLHEYQTCTKDWLFGYLSYDLKNDNNALVSNNFDGLHFPELFFFQPKKLFFLKGNELVMAYLPVCEQELVYDCDAIVNTVVDVFQEKKQLLTIQQRVSKMQYVDKVNQLLSYIQQGKVYEANFCMEFYAQNASINPYETFVNLNRISEAPFACYLKNKDKYLLSASPERYLRKIEDSIISQPIKGTAKRSTDVNEDFILKKALQNSAKERAENVMIVDLVRNDLSHTAQKGSVLVTDLCGIYTFKQVHHMISTVVSRVKPGTSCASILQTTFPMGSMTGAPKLAAMEIIEGLEESKRGLYSGAVGYFDPMGNFDFNVVIRSVLYNASNDYVSFSVGSAITAEAKPAEEYEECLLKAKAMISVLAG